VTLIISHGLVGRLESEKLWTQTLLSMSDKMLALQEEEEKFLKMQQQQDAVSNAESLSDHSAPQSPIDQTGSRDSELSRRSHEVARKLDRVVDTCNASFRGVPLGLKSKPLAPIPDTESVPEANQEEDPTLQMVC
jgi:hypothetical protein